MSGRRDRMYVHNPLAWRVGDTFCWWAASQQWWKRWAARLLGIENPAVKHEARVTGIHGNIIEYEEIA